MPSVLDLLVHRLDATRGARGRASSAPSAPAKSRYGRPSSSHTRIPSPRTSVSGYRGVGRHHEGFAGEDAHGRVLLVGVGRDHRADALGREQLEHERVLDPSVHEVRRG